MRVFLSILFVCFAGLGSAFVAHGQDASVAAKGIDWLPFDEALEEAKMQEKKLIVDVYAPWCPWCRRLQREVYTDDAIQEYLANHFIATRLDGENQSDSLHYQEYTLTPSELALGLGATGYPTTVFLDNDGAYITRLPGFVDVPQFLNVLDYIGTEAFVGASFEEFLETKK